VRRGKGPHQVMARRLHLTSCAVLAVAFLAATPGWSQQPARADAFSVLLIPVSASEPGLQPLADQISDAVKRELQTRGAPGQTLLVFHAGDPAVQRALREHPYIELPAHEAISPALADALGWALRTDATVSGVLTGKRLTTELSLRASGVKSRTARRESAAASLSPAIRAGEDADAVARWVSRLVEGTARPLAAQLPTLATAEPAAPEEHFREGERLYAEGDYAAALAEYDMASAARPDEPAYYLALARTYQALDDLQGALLAARRAQRLQPGLIESGVLIGEIYLAQERLDPALEAFEKAALADPANVATLRGLAGVYAARGDQTMALARYDRVLALNPNDMETLLSAGALAEEWGRWDEAAEYYGQAAALQPARPSLRQQIIDLRRRQGNRAAAVAALKEAQDAGVAMSYQAPEFVGMTRMMEAEAADIIAAAQAHAEAGLRAAVTRRSEDMVADLRQRSENLALAADGLTPPELLVPGHRHRVLAFHQLNESNYELTRYLQTHQRARHSRAQLLRDAARQELAVARELDTDAGWPVLTAETTERGVESAAP